MTTRIRSLLARDVFDHLLDMAIARQTNELRVELAQRTAVAKAITALLQQHEDEEAAEEGRDAREIKQPSDRKIRAALTLLVRRGLVVRYGKGLYHFNPSLFYVGESTAQVVAIEREVTRKQKPNEVRMAWAM